MKHVLLPLALLFISNALCQPAVNLPYQQINGSFGTLGIEKFLGIPYAQPGSVQRFTEAKEIDESTFSSGGVFNANATGKICAQLDSQIGEVSEDCLNLDIYRPSNMTDESKLPVMVWIFGGSFVGGSVIPYNPTSAINYASSLNLSYVFVAMNYRLNGFGFLGGKEANQAGVNNLGLKDQRLALKWIQKYISYFGGDPERVTIFGESSGAVSVAFHMLAYGGTKETNLFRSGISESGAPNTLVVPRWQQFQGVYDQVVNQTGCKGSNDTLQCLRTVPYATISPILFTLTWPGLTRSFAPMIDDDLIPDVPYKLVQQGKFVKTPVISGDNLDEGALAALLFGPFNDEQSIKNTLILNFPSISNDSLNTYVSLYPNILENGSPYNTGNRSYYGSHGKQAASILGDMAFTFPRRHFINYTSTLGAPTWTYRFEFNANPSKIDEPTYTGVTHADEIAQVFFFADTVASRSMVAYWAAFATNGDPNVEGFPVWDRYNLTSKSQIRFETNQTILRADDYRLEATQFTNSILGQLLESSTATVTSSSSLPTSTPTATQSGVDVLKPAMLLFTILLLIL